jgi:glycosyltransferase involved in cell wall biosynthesis
MTRGPRVLYVDYSLGFGGAVKSLALTLRELPDVEKFILTSQDPELVETWFRGRRVSSFRRFINYRTAGLIAARVHQPALRFAALKILATADVLASAKNFFKIIWLLRRHQIDIVHLNNWFLPPEVLVAARVANVPCVVHLRDFQTAALRLTSAAPGGVAWIISISDAVAASLDDTPISRLARTTIHDPVDLDEMQSAARSRNRIRKECGLADDDIAVGIFGRVIPWKGQLEFVRAIVLAMGINSRIQAVIVGNESDGDAGYMRQVRAQIQKSSFPERFILAGYRKNVEEYYAAMDIVVHASITPEPFGMVVPEAMAAGCAVIASDEGGPREVIEHGIDGLLVPPRDVDALSRAVLSLASDSTLRSRMAAAAKQKARARFGIAASAARIGEIYATILSRSTQ